MTTPFDRSRAKPARRQMQIECTEPSAVNDLAAMALSTLAHDQMTKDASSGPAAAPPAPHVVAMARLMADSRNEEAETLVADLLDAGVTVEELCLSHLAPAARELGRLWDCDRLPFTEVSMATARMQAILRGLPRETKSCLYRSNRGALFAAAPGETHTLGVLMAADHFRRRDWDVSVRVGLDHATLLREILGDDRPVIGLSCAGGHSFVALTHLIEDVRARRPDVAIMVSGAITQQFEAIAMLPACDGIIEGLETAEADIQAALGHARRRQTTVPLAGTR